jgi:hypothetical protein
MSTETAHLLTQLTAPAVLRSEFNCLQTAAYDIAMRWPNNAPLA